MIRKLLACSAAAGLALAPVAAQANTRAASSAVQMNAAAFDRMASPADEDGSAASGRMSLGVLIGLFGLAAALIIWGVEQGENHKSPGT